jgi:uncharacterized protein YraI
MKRTTPARLSILSTLVLALFVAACGGSQVPASATLTSPTANAQYKAGDDVQIEGKVAGSAVRSVDIFVNGQKFASIDTPARPNEFDVVLTWPSPPDTAGTSVIQLKGLNEQGEPVVSSDAVFINMEAPPPPTPTPAPPPPTSLPTAAAPTPAPAATAPTSTVTAGPLPDNDFVNVRAAPDVNANRLGQLDKGQNAPVRGRLADSTWLQINFPAAADGIGWVLASVAQVNGDLNAVPVVTPGATAGATAAVTSTTTTTTTAAATPATAATSAPAAGNPPPPFVRLKAGQDFVNVRSGPDTAFNRLGQLDATTPAASVRGKSANGQWWQIAFGTGTAWVTSQFVDFTGDANAVPVAEAPPAPTAAVAPTTAAAPPAPTAALQPLPAATPEVPPAALLPYSQSDQFQPRNDIGDVPLGHNGESRSAQWTWVINGAKSAELEIQASTPPDLYDCPAGNLAGVQPNSAAGKRVPVSLPNGSFDFTMTEPGYYVFTLHIVKNDGSTTTIPRSVIVGCYKKPGR